MLAFFWKNFQNCVVDVFIVTLIEVLCSNFVKFGRREIVEIVRCLPDKKEQNFFWLSSCRYCADRAQNLPGPALDNVLRVLQISSKSVYFWLSYSWTRDIAKLQRKVNPIFGRSLASSRIIMFDKWKIQWTVLCGSCCNAVQLPIMSPRRWTRHCLWTALLMPWN